jgi:hypothetical protein
MSDAVLAVRILEVEPIEGELGVAKYTTRVDYTAEVLSVWKGPEDRAVTLISDSPAMCGIWLREGEEYLIYTRWSDELQAYPVGICSRLFPLKDAGPDLEVLGEPVAVGTQPSSWGTVKSSYE